MSLGSWFRDYVYIPMGGNRVSKPRWFFNIFTVWMLTGFWHGAAWTFIIWGLYFAIFLCIEKLFLLKYLEKSKVLNIVNASDMGEAFEYIKGMFGFGKVPLISQEYLYYLRSYALPVALGLIGSTPVVKNTVVKLCENKGAQKVINVIEPVVLIVLAVTVTAYLVDGSFNPFLYFRF